MRLLKNLFHPSNPFGHALFGITKRNAQKSFRFTAECDARYGNHAILEKTLGGFKVIAKLPDIEHCVKGAIR
jgi:hypothetical protein